MDLIELFQGRALLRHTHAHPVSQNTPHKEALHSPDPPAKHAEMSTKHRRQRPMSTYLRSIQRELGTEVGAILAEPTAHVRPRLTYQRLYKYVEFLARDRHHSALSDELFQRLGDRTGELIGRFTGAAGGAGGPLAAIGAFITLYDVLQAKLLALERIYLYLDRTYLLHHPTKKPIMEFGHLNLYGGMVERDVWQGLLDCFLGALNTLRTHYDQASSDTLQQFWIRFHKISRWSEVEQDLLASTREFYHDAHAKVIEGHPGQQVFDVFYDALVKENNFWKGCEQNEQLVEDIKNATVAELVFQDFTTDSTKFVLPLFELKMYPSLMKLFRFIEHANDPLKATYMNALTAIWSTYIIQYVSEIISTHTDDLVETLVKSKKVLNIIVGNYFQNNVDMEYKLRESFQSALKQTHQGQINKRFLRYIDNFFRNVDVENKEENIKMIQDIHLIFKSTTDKETFINVDYRRDLARRLLHQTTKDITLELELLSLIEQEINPEVVQTLRTMFDDLKESSTLKEKYTNTSSIDFTPLILKKDNWPPNDLKSTYPPELGSLLDDFKKIYISTNPKYESRALKWSPNLGTMTITAQFPLGEKELQVTTAQGLVLLLLNDMDSLTFDQAKKGTKMDSKTVASVLYSLSQGKYKILKKESDKYTINDMFKDKRKNIKIRQIQVKIKDGEVVGEEDVMDSSLASVMSVEAFIVRYMKRVGRCSHEELLEKCREDMVVDLPLVKKCIEKMIDVEYVARVDPGTYVYLP